MSQLSNCIATIREGKQQDNDYAGILRNSEKNSNGTVIQHKKKIGPEMFADCRCFRADCFVQKSIQLNPLIHEPEIIIFKFLYITGVTCIWFMVKLKLSVYNNNRKLMGWR